MWQVVVSASSKGHSVFSYYSCVHRTLATLSVMSLPEQGLEGVSRDKLSHRNVNSTPTDHPFRRPEGRNPGKEGGSEM